jgi:hypothetical protein
MKLSFSAVSNQMNFHALLTCFSVDGQQLLFTVDPTTNPGKAT